MDPDNPDYKECCRLFYMLKGHLNTSPDTIRSSYNGYFKRLWYNNEAYLKEEGFEEAYKKHLENI